MLSLDFNVGDVGTIFRSIFTITFFNELHNIMYGITNYNEIDPCKYGHMELFD